MLQRLAGPRSVPSSQRARARPRRPVSVPIAKQVPPLAFTHRNFITEKQRWAKDATTAFRFLQRPSPPFLRSYATFSGGSTQPMGQITPLRPSVSRPPAGPALRDAETFRKLVNWSLEMRSAVQSHRPDEAIEIFSQCRVAKLRPSLAMYSELMRAYDLRGQTSKCVAVLDQMEEDGVVPDSRAITIAISSLATNDPDVELAKRLLQRASKREHPPSGVWSATVSVAAAAGDLATVESLMTEWQRLSGQRCSREMYQDSILCALKCKDDMKALEYLRIIETNRIDMHPKALDSAFALFVSGTNFVGIMAIYEYLRKRKVLNEGYIKAVLAALVRLPEIDMAAIDKIFDETIEVFPSPRGSPSTSRSEVPSAILHLYILALVRARSVNKALELIGVYNVRLNVHLSTLLSRLISENIELVDQSYFYVESLRNQGKPIDIECINIIIRACAYCRDLTRGWETYLALPNLGLEPNSSTFECLLFICSEVGNASAIIRVWREMEAYDDQRYPQYQQELAEWRANGENLKQAQVAAAAAEASSDPSVPPAAPVVPSPPPRHPSGKPKIKRTAWMFLLSIDCLLFSQNHKAALEFAVAVVEADFPAHKQALLNLAEVCLYEKDEEAVSRVLELARKLKLSTYWMEQMLQGKLRGSTFLEAYKTRNSSQRGSSASYDYQQNNDEE